MGLNYVVADLQDYFIYESSHRRNSFLLDGHYVVSDIATDVTKLWLKYCCEPDLLAWNHSKKQIQRAESNVMRIQRAKYFRLQYEFYYLVIQILTRWCCYKLV